MRIERFEELNTWIKAQELAVFIYKKFITIKDYSFRDQIIRASISVSNNIAEGFDRGSNKEFIRFLFISRGSNSEVKSMLYLAKTLELIDENYFETGISLCEESGKLINGFISYLSKLTDSSTNQLTNKQTN